MKKTIVKFTGLAALAALMIFNIQFFNADSDANSDVKISYLENIAYASSSGSGSGSGGESNDGTKCAYRTETWTVIAGQTVKLCVSGGKGNVPCC